MKISTTVAALLALCIAAQVVLLIVVGDASAELWILAGTLTGARAGIEIDKPD